ncbi:hypothetical protein [Rufibacter tibetensis]|uniref:Uncharacterized protein n=1 Tax=Rufibacter tibetensis TaxID=512763 RepID=A0A0P0D3P1_9BACT|nr:hypothetical protein [Rufibacter tibetensis]ALJ01712.1 hypothetical protein DC20_21940 [Rufibacter tibetensis]
MGNLGNRNAGMGKPPGIPGGLSGPRPFPVAPGASGGKTGEQHRPQIYFGAAGRAPDPSLPGLPRPSEMAGPCHETAFT